MSKQHVLVEASPVLLVAEPSAVIEDWASGGRSIVLGTGAPIERSGICKAEQARRSRACGPKRVKHLASLTSPSSSLRPIAWQVSPKTMERARPPHVRQMEQSRPISYGFPDVRQMTDAGLVRAFNETDGSRGDVLATALIFEIRNRELDL